jgi:putative copper resistance protein D
MGCPVVLAALDPLSPATVITNAAIDPTAAVLTTVAALLYVGGVRRLARRGRRWSPMRSLSFGIGIAVLLVATQSGLAAYDTLLFSAHIAQHVLLGVVAPLFLALGAPVTLALQASHRHTQVNLLRLIRSRPVRAIGHPVVAFVLFSLSLFVLYFSGLYELSLRNDVVHAWTHVHFVVVGSLFFWVTIGLDPVAHRIPYGARLLIVALTVPFHAFLGLALLSTTEPIAAAVYGTALDRPVGIELLADQRAGATVMWIIGDLIGLIAGGIVAVQWFRHEQRQTRRLDRELDAIEARSTAADPPDPDTTMRSAERAATRESRAGDRTAR